MEKTKITQEDAFTLLILAQQRKTVEHNEEILTANKARGISQAAILSIAKEYIDRYTEEIFETAMNGGDSIELTYIHALTQEKAKLLIERYFVRLGYVVTVDKRAFHISW